MTGTTNILDFGEWLNLCTHSVRCNIVGKTENEVSKVLCCLKILSQLLLHQPIVIQTPMEAEERVMV